MNLTVFSFRLLNNLKVDFKDEDIFNTTWPKHLDQ